MKKYLIFGLALGLALVFGLSSPTYAATPTLSLSSVDSDNAQVTVNGDADNNVLLFYYRPDGSSRLQYLGKTNGSGYFSGSVSTSNLNISSESIVYVTVNAQNSTQKTWPIGTSGGTSGALTLSQTGVVMKTGQSVNLNVSNAGTQSLYLLNNSNPQVANVNINSNTQISINANTYGQTVVTVCALGTTSNCASVYVTVQNNNAQALTFSQSTLTVAHNQNATVTILNGSGAYSVVNNSNPSVIQTSLSGSTITMTASNNTGTAALTVCSADMSSCGIINATAGTTSSSSITFNQTAPSIYIGQSSSIAMSGGSNYNISSNSNSNVINASISGSNLILNGNLPGSSTITVCASNGNCASLTATVSYASNGGALTLSQTNLWLQAGQAVSVVISGGSTPYNLGITTNSNLYSTNLNGNILTITGIAAGSGMIDVCSAGGACVTLSVLVNGTATNTQLTFSNNNLSLAVGAETQVSLFGAGGYYISASNNQQVATLVISGTKVAVKAISAGNANATVCQTGGQCSVLYVSVAVSANATPPTFSPNNPEISVNQIQNINLTGGDGNTYFLASNANPTIVEAGIAGKVLTAKGLQAGSSVLSICSATNNCASISVKVNAISSNNTNTNNTGNSGANTTTGSDLLEFVALESQYITAGNADIVAGNVNATRSSAAETASYAKYIAPLIKNYAVSVVNANKLNYFVWFGTPTTLKLGAGERAGVLSSYWQAYQKLPQTASDWSDVLKIASGRWPSQISVSAETQAKLEFKKVYDRNAVMTNNKDANAVTIIAYGLRPTARNTVSEKSAINSFRYVYAHDPISPLAWNIVRAIAYSGTSK